jgi:hypothetical protein
MNILKTGKVFDAILKTLLLGKSQKGWDLKH